MKFIAPSLKKSALRQRGQGMTEYIIIVALIAVAAIGVYSMFGQTIRGQVAGLAGEVSGKANTGKTEAQSASDAAQKKAAADKGMGSYDSGNSGK